MRRKSEGKLKGLSWTTIMGLSIGAVLLIVSVFPPPPWKAIGSPAVIDVQIATPIPLQPGANQFPIEHTRFTFERRAVFFEFTFSGLNSSANILVLLPFRIENVTTYPGWTSPFLFYLRLGKTASLGNNYWLANATLANDYGYSNMVLNGTLGMKLSLSDDFMNIGPWQSSLQVSFGSNTSPLYSNRCPSGMSCWPVFRNSSVSVVVGFPHNQIIGGGTFPSPAYIATNEYGRGVVWNFSSSSHFNDLQLFLVANSPAWGLPLPFVGQLIMQSVALVILEVVVTRSFIEWKRRKEQAQQPSRNTLEALTDPSVIRIPSTLKMSKQSLSNVGGRLKSFRAWLRWVLWWHGERVERILLVSTFLLYLSLFFSLVFFVPLTNGLIFRTAQSLLIVEGVLFGLMGVVESRRWRTEAVFLSAISIIVSLITIILSDVFQEAPVTRDMATAFASDVFLFGLLLEVYFLALLRPPRKRWRR